MTENEWKERAAKRFIDKAEVTEERGKEMAEALFHEQDGVFCESATDYNPEACADEEMQEWAHNCR